MQVVVGPARFNSLIRSENSEKLTFHLRKMIRFLWDLARKHLTQGYKNDQIRQLKKALLAAMKKVASFAI